MSSLTKQQESKKWYLSIIDPFLDHLNGDKNTCVKEFRDLGLEKMNKLDFPTLKDEEWKYTNISPILQHNFEPALLNALQETDEKEVAKHLFKDFDFHKIVFVNGVFNSDLSSLGELPSGVAAGNLRSLIHSHPEIVKEYLNKNSDDDNFFNAMNSACTYDGFALYVPEGKHVEKPFQLLFLNGNSSVKVLSQPRNLLVLGGRSSAKVIASYQGLGSNEYLSNIVTEIYLGEEAVLDFYKVQNESVNAFHINKTQAFQSRGSVFSHYSISFGSKIARNDINSVLKGTNCECNLYGIYLANEQQHMDNHTFVDHASPNCVSNELYKGILDDESRGVFNGKIMVRKDAQKTNAYQSNKSVLLSGTARIDTKPQLEIYADDVRCTHGATIGQLDETSLFYLRSRGISSEIAKSMLIRAFAFDVIDSVKIPEIREQIHTLIFEHLHREIIKND